MDKQQVAGAVVLLGPFLQGLNEDLDQTSSDKVLSVNQRTENEFFI